MSALTKPRALAHTVYAGCELAESWRSLRRSWPSTVRALYELGFYAVSERLDEDKTCVVAWLNGVRFEL